MRTTLAIDDDVLAAAKHLAAQRQKTVGQALSALARQGLMQPQSKAPASRNGLLLLPMLQTKHQTKHQTKRQTKRQASKPVTMSLVNQLRDEMP